MGGTSSQHLCQLCPHGHGVGMNTDKMPSCQLMACTTIATLPVPNVLPGRISQRAAYPTSFLRSWIDARPAPDQLPPRSITRI